MTGGRPPCPRAAGRPHRRAPGGALLVLLTALLASCGATGVDERPASPTVATSVLVDCGELDSAGSSAAAVSTVTRAWLDHEGRSALDEGEVIGAYGCTEDGLWGTVRSPANLVVVLVEPAVEPTLLEVAEIAPACADERLLPMLGRQLGC